MGAQPFGEGGFVQFAGREGKHRCRRFRLRDNQTLVIQGEEETDCQKCRPFVAIDEGVVTRDTEAVGGSERRNIRFPIDGQIGSSGQSGIEQASIPQTRRTTMFRETFAMQEQQRLTVDPTPRCHFANA